MLATDAGAAMEPEEPLGVERRLEEDLAARMPPLTMSSSCNKRRKEKGERLLNVSGVGPVEAIKKVALRWC